MKTFVVIHQGVFIEAVTVVVEKNKALALEAINKMLEEKGYSPVEESQLMAIKTSVAGLTEITDGDY